MSLKLKDQHIAVFGERGSGKTVLISSFYGMTQDPSYDTSLYAVRSESTKQGNALLANYLQMLEDDTPPLSTAAGDAQSFTFVLDLTGEARPKEFDGLRLVWHDYPGEWFTEDPSTQDPEELEVRVRTFRNLMRSDVAFVLVDGQKLLDYAGQEEKYLKLLLADLRNELLNRKDQILLDGEKQERFPRIWVFALSKADLHPDMDVQRFRNLMVKKAQGDMAALGDALKEFVTTDEALSIGEDFILLSSAKFEPGAIRVHERVGLDLILPVATVLPLERVAQWARKYDISAKVLASLAENIDDYLPKLMTALQIVATKIPKVGPLVSLWLIPALEQLEPVAKDQLEHAYRAALARKDYGAATLARFGRDLAEGEERKVLRRGGQ